MTSALGQKQTSGFASSMSAFRSKADIFEQRFNVCLCPRADMETHCHLSNRLVRARRRVCSSEMVPKRFSYWLPVDCVVNHCRAYAVDRDRPGKALQG